MLTTAMLQCDRWLHLCFYVWLYACMYVSMYVCIC